MSTIQAGAGSLKADAAENEAAMSGQAVPHILPPAVSEMTVWCLIHGIRRNDGFATELHGNPELPVITRALNARAIISNRVPDVEGEESMPYCFWHPDLPSEETLRAVLSRYQARFPSLRYQVGRACAAAGYTRLYSELDLLPDAAIAEEARDNKVNGQAIYELIVQQPTRYAVMDNYNRLVRDEPIPGASLNGDTCVRSSLDKPQPAGDLVNAETVAKLSFDITEDRNMSLTGVFPTKRPVSPETIRLLFTPLPRDLPTVDKDLLILITFFAKWWSTLPHTQHERLLLGSDRRPGRNNLLEHVHARLVMNNDLSWLTDSTPESELPRLIWHPHFASVFTYAELARRRPSMKKTCVTACIRYGDQGAFTRFGEVVPDHDLWTAALGQDWHLQWIEDRAKELGIELFPPNKTEQEMEEWHQRRAEEWEITTGDVGFDSETAAMPGWKAAVNEFNRYVGVDRIELHVSALENVAQLVPEGYKLRDMVVAYRDWMYVEEEHVKILGLSPDPARPKGGYRQRGRGRGGRVLRVLSRSRPAGDSAMPEPAPSL
ncbi:hypothetical protein VTK56DRAFT_8186 [Thermocarpiscus australiensis]